MRAHGAAARRAPPLGARAGDAGGHGGLRRPRQWRPRARRRAGALAPVEGETSASSRDDPFAEAEPRKLLAREGGSGRPQGREQPQRRGDAASPSTFVRPGAATLTISSRRVRADDSVRSRRTAAAANMLRIESGPRQRVEEAAIERRGGSAGGANRPGDSAMAAPPLYDSVWMSEVGMRVVAGIAVGITACALATGLATGTQAGVEELISITHKLTVTDPGVVLG